MVIKQFWCYDPGRRVTDSRARCRGDQMSHTVTKRLRFITNSTQVTAFLLEELKYSPTEHLIALSANFSPAKTDWRLTEKKQ